MNISVSIPEQRIVIKVFNDSRFVLTKLVVIDIVFLLLQINHSRHLAQNLSSHAGQTKLAFRCIGSVI